MAKRLIVPPSGPIGTPVPDAPHFIDFQVSAARLISLLENRFRAQAICAYTEFEWVPDSNHPNQKETLALDHLEFQGGSVLQVADQPVQVWFTPWSPSGQAPPQPLSIKPLQIVVPVTLIIKKKTDLLTPGNTSVFLTPSIKLLANLTTSGANFSASFAGIDFGGWIGMFQVDPKVLAKITSLAQNQANVTTPFDPGISTLFDGTQTITNSALVGTADLQAVALHFELGGPNTFKQDWLSFYEIAVPTLLNGQDWSCRLDTNAIASQIIARTTGTLEKKTQIQVTSGLDYWTIPLGDSGLLVLLSFDIKIVDGPCHWVGVDVGVSVTISISLRLTANNLIVAHSVVSYSANDWDMFECSFFLTAGAAAFHTLTAEILKSIVLGSYSLPNQPGCTQVDKVTFDCPFPLDPKPIKFQPWDFDFGKFTAKAFQGRIDGTCMISGSLDVLSIGLPDLGVDIEPPEFAWDIVGSCGSLNIGASVDAGFGSSPMPVGPGAVLCLQPQVLNDPLGVFSNALTTSGGQPWLPLDLTFTFNLSDLPSNHPYWSYPAYPCVVFVATSAGALSISIPPIPKPTADELTKLNQSLGLAEAACENRSLTFFGPPAYFELIWLVDPPPDLAVFSQWEASYAGVATGEELRFQSASGNVTATGSPLRGVAQIGGWERAAQGSTPARLVRGVAPTPSASPSVESSVASVSRRLRVRQQQYIRRSVIGLRGECTDLAVGGMQGIFVALCTTSAGLNVYNLSTPLIPDSLDQIDAAGIRGAMPWNNRLLIWGDGGIGFAGSTLRKDGPVIAAVRAGMSVCLLKRESVELLDRELRLRSKREMHHTGHLATAGNFVLVSDETGVRIFDVSDPAQPRDAGHFPLAGVSGLQVPVVANAGKSVLVNLAQESVLLAFDTNGPQIAARYPDTPWYAGAIRFRQLLVKLTANSTQLEVYTAGRAGSVSIQGASTG